MIEDTKLEVAIPDSLKIAFSSDTAKAVVLELISRMENREDNDFFEYDFSLSRFDNTKKGEKEDISQKERNVALGFDLTEGSALGDVHKAMYGLQIVTAGHTNYVNDWLKSVCDMISGDYKKDMEDAICRGMVGDKYIPVNILSVLSLEMLDLEGLEDTNYLISIEKHVPKSVSEAQEAGENVVSSVSAELFSIHAETGLGFNEIVAKKQAEGDPAYADVKEVHVKKLFTECLIGFIVDFSEPSEASDQKSSAPD